MFCELKFVRFPLSPTSHPSNKIKQMLCLSKKRRGGGEGTKEKAKAGEQFALSVAFVREGMMHGLDLYLCQQGSSVLLKVSPLQG